MENADCNLSIGGIPPHCTRCQVCNYMSVVSLCPWAGIWLAFFVFRCISFSARMALVRSDTDARRLASSRSRFFIAQMPDGFEDKSNLRKAASDMNVKRKKLKRIGTKSTALYSERQRENQKRYLRNWERNMTVNPVPIPHRIRKGAQ